MCSYLVRFVNSNLRLRMLNGEPLQNVVPHTSKEEMEMEMEIYQLKSELTWSLIVSTVK